MTSPIQLVPPSIGITYHAWNADFSQLAICPNNNELHIYTNCQNPDSTQWQLSHVLRDHDLLISAVDWCPVSNRIVTCSHDRNAFVWSYDESTSTWKPSLVVLRIDRSALCVKWSPDGQKFAVGAGSKNVAVCYFENSENWWVSKIIKKHKSSIVSLSWHPNSQVIATASTDMKCRVISADVSEIDTVQLGFNGVHQPFGEVYHEFPIQGWVNDVSWSPSGETLVFVGHNSSISFGTFQPQQVVQNILTEFLPFAQVLLLSENACVAAGHDNFPIIYTRKSDGLWSFFKKLDSQDSSAEETKTSTVAAARSMFQNKAKTGQTTASKARPMTLHSSFISCLRRFSNHSDPVYSAFTTSAIDGKIVTWKLETFGIDLNALRI
jgi:actin related protein 2/3 complex subunit 1A/1B